MRPIGVIAVSAALAVLTTPQPGAAAQRAYACSAELSLRSAYPAPLEVYVRLYRSAPPVAALCPWRTQGGRAVAQTVWRPAPDCSLPQPFADLAAPTAAPTRISLYAASVLTRRCSPFFKSVRPNARDEVYLIRPMRTEPDRSTRSLMADLTIAQTRTGAPYDSVTGGQDWMCVEGSAGAPSPLALVDATVRPGVERRFSEQRLHGTSCADVAERRNDGG
jgi:hypothetical protein